MENKTLKPNRYILRNEVFGKTLFDRTTLSHTLLGHNDARLKDINPNEVTDWGGDITGKRSDILYSPIRIYFDLTESCNLRCRTCYNSSGEGKPDEMSLDQVVKTLQGVRNDNVFDIRFSGGELTQRPDWFEILQEAKQLGFSVSANTNGVYTDPTVIDKLTSLDLEQITFSLDGDQQLHDFIRGRGTYDKVTESIRQLSERGNILRVNSIITKGTQDVAKDILDFAVQYVDEINFFYFRPLGRGAKLIDHAVDFYEHHALNEYLSSIKQPYMDAGMNVLHGEAVIRDNSIAEKFQQDLGLQPGQTDGFTRWNIAQNGDMSAGGYTLHICPELDMGNIITEGYSLLNIWHNSDKLDIFRKKSYEAVERCNTCDEKDYRCAGEGVELTLYREKTGDNPYCKYRGIQNDK